MHNEFEFINEIREKFSLKKIGDDCAVLPKSKTHDMIITADLIVENIDFRRTWISPTQLGYKSLAVSLSDIAAMGGTPLFSMLSIGIPQALWETEFLNQFYSGYHSVANEFGVELVGGDISKTPDKIVVDSIVIGETKKKRAVLRSGAKPGDLIFVTGELGGSAGGLMLLEKGVLIGEESAALVEKQLMPVLRVREGISLSRYATSMIDISDGLSSDLRHICEMSGVGARLSEGKIPIDRNLRAITTNQNEQLNFALHGGEDFELLFTCDPKKNYQAENDQFFCIGEITANEGIIELIGSDTTSILEAKGFKHF